MSAPPTRKTDTMTNTSRNLFDHIDELSDAGFMPTDDSDFPTWTVDYFKADAAMFVGADVLMVRENLNDDRLTLTLATASGVTYFAIDFPASGRGWAMLLAAAATL